MAKPWSQSVASLESIFAVLSDHDHPFVLIGKYALRWMGVQVIPGEIMDILVRTSQAASICQALAQTGEWLEVDESSIPSFVTMVERVDHRSIRRFKRCDDRWYISLCSEDTYDLTVDTKKIQVLHPVNLNSVLVESEFHPNPTDRGTDYWASRPYLMTDKNISFIWAPGGLVSFPVFIPTLPEFIDSCLSCMGGQSSEHNPSFGIARRDMDYLGRYLLLDLPHQQDKLLSKVKNTKQLAEFFMGRQQRQERRMKLVMESQAECAAHAKPGPQVPFIMKPLG
ncbi:hypothetical protein B9Z19DRAFT_1083504 [Tuber borchii]|uniref:Uncharacterized protein n=1 Tax=Tuber borchii TaxID=42251 RepID=A0A2T6ZTD4_TUBBO|nr:hypothetical protein B9Z19DRAFT_1083504 [Tuber borchii]